MRSSNQTGRTKSSSGSKTAYMPLTAIGIASIVLAIILMAIFCASAFAGSNKRNPEVIFYGFEGNFPRTSMTNTLHAAGFNYSIQNDLESLDDERYYVIAATGDNAADVVQQYKDNPSVLGFVLICPTIPEGQSLDGISSSYPEKDIAIFAGRDDTNNVSEISDARILYERLSGDDTVYGTPIKRGGLFASRCFINNNQNRYLSLSNTRYDSAHYMLMSPMFQNELAGYLGVTYQHNTIKDVSFARINSWFVMLAVALLAFVFGEALYLALLPVTMKTYVNTTTPASERIATIATVIVAGITTVGVVLVFSMDSMRKFAGIYICALPVIFMATMMFSKLKLMLNNDARERRTKEGIVRPLFMAASTGMIVFFSAFAFGDLKVDINFPTAIIGVICFIFDSLLAGMLFSIDRNARELKQGGTTYFGNFIFIILMLVPSLVMLVLGLVTGVTTMRSCGIGGIAITLIPYLSIVPIRRHSEHTLIASVLHGLVFTTLFLLIA